MSVFSVCHVYVCIVVVTDGPAASIVSVIKQLNTHADSRDVVNRLAIQPKLKQLDCYEEKGIIMKRDEPTEWVSSLLGVEKKDGSLRVCLDPKDLNRAIRENTMRYRPSRTFRRSFVANLCSVSST